MAWRSNIMISDLISDRECSSLDNCFLFVMKMLDCHYKSILIFFSLFALCDRLSSNNIICYDATEICSHFKNYKS